MHINLRLLLAFFLASNNIFSRRTRRYRILLWFLYVLVFDLLDWAGRIIWALPLRTLIQIDYLIAQIIINFLRQILEILLLLLKILARCLRNWILRSVSINITVDVSYKSHLWWLRGLKLACNWLAHFIKVLWGSPSIIKALKTALFNLLGHPLIFFAGRSLHLVLNELLLEVALLIPKWIQFLLFASRNLLIVLKSLGGSVLIKLTIRIARLLF